MKKISEQTKNFLLYGIDHTIQPKEIYKLDGAILFLVFLFFFLAEASPLPAFQSLIFSILFCWAGTIFMLTTMEKESYKGYLAVLAVIYILAIAAYLFLTMLLIKKDVYNPSSSKKVAGGWCITSFVLLGIGAAKVLSTKAEYTTMIRIASLGFYFVSLLCILGVFHLVKYFAVKKNVIRDKDFRAMKSKK